MTQAKGLSSIQQDIPKFLAGQFSPHRYISPFPFVTDKACTLCGDKMLSEVHITSMPSLRK